jgi:radical SAM protein with 4Fe4S-binding SPASM domain
MSIESFRRLLDGRPDLEAVVLQGIGEPLMAPDIYEMVAEASRRGIFTEFNSNATLLTRKAGERLLDAGLGALHISLDGATKETYEFVRDQSNWDIVQRNVAGFVGLMRERGATKPELSLVTVLMQRNLDEIEGVVRQASQWGIPSVFVQNLSHDFSDAPRDAYDAIAAYVQEQHVSGLPRKRVDEAFARARATARELGVELRLPSLDGRHQPVALADGTAVGCDWPWEGGYVTRDGTVLPCCMVMGEGRIAFGNVNVRSYDEIWSDEEFQRFRDGLINGHPHPVCQGCSLYRGTF